MVDPNLARAYGTLAGYGFIGVSLLTFPSTLLLDPQPDPEAYFLTLAGLLTGLCALAIPWDLIDPRWLHLLGIVATAETAATVAVFGQPYVALYFLIAVLVAYISPGARTLALQVGVICMALFGAALWGPESVRESLNVALVTAPSLLLAVALFGYLRLKMVSDRRAYHRFAEQTLVLASQIAGREFGSPAPMSRREPVERLSGVRPPGRLIAGAAVTVGLPLFAGGLAVAGVHLPGVAQEPFEQVGIDLPNQEAPVTAVAPERRGPARAATATGGHEKAVKRVDRETGPAQAAGGESAAPTTPEAATDTSRTAPPTPETPASSPPSGEEPETPAATPEVPAEPSPIDDVLDQAQETIQGVLDQVKLDQPPPAGGD